MSSGTWRGGTPDPLVEHLTVEVRPDGLAVPAGQVVTVAQHVSHMAGDPEPGVRLEGDSAGRVVGFDRPDHPLLGEADQVVELDQSTRTGDHSPVLEASGDLDRQRLIALDQPVAGRDVPAGQVRLPQVASIGLHYGCYRQHPAGATLGVGVPAERTLVVVTSHPGTDTHDNDCYRSYRTVRSRSRHSAWPSAPASVKSGGEHGPRPWTPQTAVPKRAIRELSAGTDLPLMAAC